MADSTTDDDVAEEQRRYHVGGPCHQRPGANKGWQQRLKQLKSQEARKGKAADARRADAAESAPAPAPADPAPSTSTAAPAPTTAGVALAIDEGSLPLTSRFRPPDCSKCGHTSAACTCGGGGSGGGGDTGARCNAPVTMADLNMLIERVYQAGASGKAPPKLRLAEDGLVTLLIDGEPAAGLSASDKVWFPCSCSAGWNPRDTNGLCARCGVQSASDWCHASVYLACFDATFCSSHRALKRYAGMNSQHFPSPETIKRVRRALLLPAMRELMEGSVNRALRAYKTWYLARYPTHTGPIPIGFIMDTRWQKPWGWNSLDGHATGRFFCPDEGRTPLPADMPVSIGAWPCHRDTPGGRERYIAAAAFSTSSSAIGELFADSANAMESANVEAVVNKLLADGFDVVHLLHDNDFKAMARVRQTKSAYMEAHPDHRLRKCNCKAPSTTSSSSDVCTTCYGVDETLCIRHGSKHAGKDMVNIAEVGAAALPADMRGTKGRPHWLRSDACATYVRTAFKDIATKSTSGPDMERRVADFIQHLKGRHTSEFCIEYGTCQASDWTPTFQATTDAEHGVLEVWRSKWGSKRACAKYWPAETTNFEESQNALMISLLAKRIFGADTSRYDCCAFACPLFVNERGWNFALQLDGLVGHRTSDARRQTVLDQEAQALRNMNTKRSFKRQRRKELFKLRKGQNKKHNKPAGDLHRSKTRHPERDDAPPRKRAPGKQPAVNTPSGSAPTQRCCSVCHQPGHNARTCKHNVGVATAATTAVVPVASAAVQPFAGAGSAGDAHHDDDDDDDDDDGGGSGGDDDDDDDDDDDHDSMTNP